VRSRRSVRRSSSSRGVSSRRVTITANGGDKLEGSGSYITQGGCIVSKNGSHRACLQNTGNLVVQKANSGTLESKWKKIPGSGVAIDADQQGNAVGATKTGTIYKYNGSRWERLPGRAKDVCIGSEGTIWAIGTNVEGGGFGIYKMINGKWKKIPGSANRIACGPDGNAWVVNKQGSIYQYTGRGWARKTGKATDIGVGPEGTVWAIGTRREGGGYSIFKNDGRRWKKIPGSAVRISVGPDGNAWVANKQGRIYSHNGKKWAKQTGRAKDVGVGANGAVWVIGTNKEAGGYGIYRRAIRIANAAQEKIAGSAVRVDTDGSGLPWVVNKNNHIFRHNGKRWTRYPGAAKDIGVNSAGQVWIIGTNKEGGGYGIYRWVGKSGKIPRNGRWQKYAGSAVRISVGPDGNAWVVNKNGYIYRSKGTRGWTRISGRAKDIGVGENGQMWVIGTKKEVGGYAIYKYNAKTRKYKKVVGSGTDISVDKGGNPWVVTIKKNVWFHNGKRWIM
jgi:hypothetical protein